ncbi:MAG: DUF4178 domain-containing protein [Planctomycetaceae bacterium]
MKRKVAACPSCGGPVEFQISTSLVTVCGFCNSAVARADKKVEDHGKVADLVQTNSSIQLGLRGTFNRKGFNVVGRVQYRHPAGGVWDEWYLLFSSGRWGWLAEAQGKTYLTFEKKLAPEMQVPDFDELSAGAPFQLGSLGKFVVAEKGTATTISADGEIPWNFTPGEEVVSADLQGPDGGFATFEYKNGKAIGIYIGVETTLDALGLPIEAEEVGGFETANTAALSLNCPNCAGPLTLHAPDATERVCCPNCSSLLDTSEGKLEYFSTLKMKKVKPVLPLGKTGTFRGVEYTIIGFMERFTRYAGTVYPWTEYLLYAPGLGFRWLVHSEGHWTFAKPISVGDIQHGGARVTYKDEGFRLFDRYRASVRYVVGEFYWKVLLGEEVSMRDFIAPPQMISMEKSIRINKNQPTEELNVSLASHVPHEELEEAFGVEELWRPWSVGPAQPRPKNGGVFMLWLAFAGVLFGINLLFSALASGTGVDQWLFFYALVFVSVIPIGTLLYNYQFEVNRWKDSDFSPYATHDD